MTPEIIIAVDDDVYILRMLKRTLENAGFAIMTASSADDALALFAGHVPDLVLMDVTMPVMDGYSLSHHIREFSGVPIIMVTARGGEDEIVKGLEAGADDYIVKPFSGKELIARIRANLSRGRDRGMTEEPVFCSKDLVIDFTAGTVKAAGKDVELTATEYRILSYLARNAGRVLTPDQIMENVWGDSYRGETHLLQVNMARLRRKIEQDPRDPIYILTRPSIGYSMQKS